MMSKQSIPKEQIDKDIAKQTVEGQDGSHDERSFAGGDPSLTLGIVRKNNTLYGKFAEDTGRFELIPESDNTLDPSGGWLNIALIPSTDGALVASYGRSIKNEIAGCRAGK